MHHARHTSALVCLGIALVPHIVLSTETNSYLRPLRATSLLGSRIENSAGEELGTLQDFVVDLQEGRLRYVIIASGGLLGVGAKLRAVPAHLVSAATTKRDTLSLDVRKQHWERAPIFKSSELSHLGEPARVQQIRQFYHQAGFHGTAQSGNGTDESRAANTDPAASQNASPARLILAGDLIGERIVNHDKERLGQILDLLIVFSEADSGFALISTSHLTRPHAFDYAAPLWSFQATKDGRLMMNASPDSFRQAPPLSREGWEAAHGSKGATVYRYSTSTSN